MGLLLDSATLIWWVLDSGRLSVAAKHAIRSAPRILVSSVTAMELATKLRIGKLPQVKPLVEAFAAQCSAEGFELLALRHEHALVGGTIPGEHRDPFDRMLAGQAIVEDLTIMSPDLAFDALGARRLW
ncbi:type II toxin-antitoxin system VapC family toxin [Bosea minatitlanensis]|uniref:Type II toxin-antitoxin system VapC family toxin n=1 Tax=Bosea minatitlanensis TaxID=128782 RepID=A0ABW0F7E3_9HYPH|nr:type II toxin-antitoxin system VapC family toxin [Bosea minatitlanensis]MCT4493078.1 type II toxin-antitoxin system VapC family toxin [Bosea minatitlanensis]